MKCIFCKQDATHSKSVEHIVPESLGNKNNVLPKGVVCDKCNNYFALKVEKKVLETDFFKNLRHRNGIESKKGKIPKGKALIPKTKYEADVILHKKKEKPIEVILDTESFDLVRNGKIKHLILPFNTNFQKDDKTVSRFLAKIGLEMMALRILEKDKNDQDFFAEEPALDPVRNYARFNQQNENWVYSSRKIYEEDESFFLENGQSMDMVFECDFLATQAGEMYFVIAFKGIEFVLNMAGSSIEGYENWLIENNNISPLYAKGKNFGYKLTPNFMKK
ncbi:HNH endonuclease [Maribacter sp. MJ134]|uniref:HNH endonuclease n=1 Tax=Maribacter sp. MJ134 TaxID=2496865 RepID=UPI000F84B7D2|nr:HNH endonuclease [Maribacter sp. MJ134]AZQ57294.1 HNH endonuclease [Maribacter sp. MJ134]